MKSADRSHESVWRRLTPLFAALLVLASLTPLLPEMALDSALADAVVRITDTGAWPQIAFVVLGLTAMLVSRPGVDRSRRSVEVALILAAMLVVLAGNGLLNEHVVKPAFGVARPNIVELADGGLLGADFPDADTFYSIGGKGIRREVLAERFALIPDLGLSDLVEAHWIHETGFSFPSGHSTAAVTLAAFFGVIGVWWLEGWRRYLTILLVPLWAVLVVYSRPLLEVHTEIDVIVGTAAGVGWGVAAAAGVDWMVQRRFTRSDTEFAR